MSRLPREIWLGDVVRAAHALGADDSAGWRRAAELLGLGNGADDHDRPAPPPPGDPAPPSPEPAPHDAAPAHIARPGPDPAPAGTPPAGPAPEDGAPLTPTDRRPPRRTGWSVDPLPAPRTAAGSVPAGAPPYVPLLAPGSTAAVLHALLARIAPEGDLDVERAADHLARGLPLDEIPRRPLPTLRHGVQILADISPSMEPFAQDVEHVVDQVRSIVGVAGTQVLRFADCPSRGAGPGPRGTWRRYRPPQHGTRVLLLSGLGMLGPVFDPHRGSEREWRETLLRIRQHGCDAVALVPVPERLWPAWWRTWLRPVPWDRGTTVGRVVGGLR